MQTDFKTTLNIVDPFQKYAFSWTLANKRLCNLYWNATLFFSEDGYQNVVCTMQPFCLALNVLKINNQMIDVNISTSAHEAVSWKEDRGFCNYTLFPDYHDC